MSAVQHTPTPWQVDCASDAFMHRTIRPSDGTPNGCIDGQPIATVYEHADSEFIVQCVNSHGALVDALRGLLNATSNGTDICAREFVAAAIAALCAAGETP